jgi:pimeloyl-ACP methyl ester carboxylesterase
MPSHPGSGDGQSAPADGATVELATTEVGVGGRPLLAVHGFTGAKEDFWGQAGRLAERGWHVVMPDLRGHGASPGPVSGYDLATMASDLVALADCRGWSRFAVVGHSMGGMVAQRLALDAPGRVSALVLVGTTDGPVAVNRAVVELACTILGAGGMPALLDAQRALGATVVTTSSSVERLRVLHPDWDVYRDGSFLACSPDMYAEVARGLLDTPSRLPELAALDVPTLVVVGDEDDVMLPGSLRLAKTIPDAELVVLSPAGHHPQAELADEFAAVVGRFLDGTVAPPIGVDEVQA